MFFNICLRAQEVIQGHVHSTEKTPPVQSKPEGTVETISLKMRQFLSLSRQEKIHARSLQENNARSTPNQSARTIVAI